MGIAIEQLTTKLLKGEAEYRGMTSDELRKVVDMPLSDNEWSWGEELPEGVTDDMWLSWPLAARIVIYCLATEINDQCTPDSRWGCED
jgi:hypothetical protein